MENALIRWAIVLLGVAMIAVALCRPWYYAITTHGRAALTGWGSWQASGQLGAVLRPLPFGFLIVLAAGFMIVCAVRSMFGGTVIGAMACLAIGVLPVLIGGTVNQHLAGSESVAVELGPAAKLVINLAIVASVVCWIGFARCVLRAAPRAES